MQLASAWLILDKRGSNVPIRGVTPAELIILIRDRTDFVGKHPVHDLKITGKSRRSNAMERQRLREKYGGSLKDRKVAKVDALYPGEGNPLPETFEELGQDYKSSTSKDASLQNVVPSVPDFGDTELEKLSRLEELEMKQEAGENLSLEEAAEIETLAVALNDSLKTT